MAATVVTEVMVEVVAVVAVVVVVGVVAACSFVVVVVVFVFVIVVATTPTIFLIACAHLSLLGVPVAKRGCNVWKPTCCLRRNPNPLALRSALIFEMRLMYEP